ncbi:MAG: hypothetical protein HY453_00490 [Parcubacteria group bacterium]|nr:hypothetical protein [Parcubacteria group bacterium]
MSKTQVQKPAPESLVKIVSLGIVCIILAYYFGWSISKVEGIPAMIGALDFAIIPIVIHFAIAQMLLIMSIDIVVAVVRPFSYALTIFLFSSLAMFFASPHIIGAVVLFVFAFFTLKRVDHEISSRIRFSVTSLSAGRIPLLIGILAIISMGFYYGVEKLASQNQIVVSPRYEQKIIGWSKDSNLNKLPPAERKTAEKQIETSWHESIASINAKYLVPNQAVMASASAVAVFASLITLIIPFNVMTTILLYPVFLILKKSRFVFIHKENVEAQRLSLSAK